MANAYIQSNEIKFIECLDFLKKDLSALRTGRAHPSMVENILVDSYGARSPIKHVASITIPEARTLKIQPWDKTIIKNIEKAIIEANIGINPVNEGNVIRLTIPLMTSEDRIKMVKNLNEKLEQGKIKVRHVRDEIKEKIILAEKNKAITEDEKYAFLEALDSTTKEYNNTIKKMGEEKEKELMTI